MKTLHLLISGKVQGVFYRASAKEKADKLGITGWIKNTAEGHVEAMASGNEDAMEAFVRWCREGPEHALVTGVRITQKENESHEGFRIIRG